METLWQDLRYGARMLARNPGFTAVAVLTLALGIGANTAIFSVVNAVLLRPLPFQKPDRLVFLQETARRETVETRPLSYPNFLDWREQNKSFGQMAAWDQITLSLSGEGEAERITGEAVSAGYFSLLGVQPILGRGFLPSEDATPEGDLVAILGYGLWQRRFEGNPQVVGETIRLDGRNYTVVGVAPEGFGGIGEGIDIWIPFTSYAARQALLDRRGARWFFAVGRLRAGVTLEQAQAEMETIAGRLEQQYPDPNQGRGARLLSLSDAFFGDFEQPLLVLLGAVGFVLLIACANVASLTLARAIARQKEVAIRAALGAGRARIARQVLTESVLLAALGGLAGLLLALWATDFLMTLLTQLPGIVEVRIDPFVLGFTFLLAVLTGLVSGLAPALQLSRTNPQDSLREGGRGPESGTGHTRLRNLLVVSELALALVLLIGAGLLLRSFQALITLDPGFRAEGVLTGRITLPNQEYSGGQLPVFSRELLDRMAVLPSVEVAALGTDFPLGGSTAAMFVTIEGRPANDPTGEHRVYSHRVSSDFFQALGIPLARGRTFSSQDTPEAPGVVIISESAAHRFWPGESPIGKRLMRGSFDPDNPWWKVVGVVGDVRYRTLAAGQNNDPDVYFSLTQLPTRFLGIVLRSAADARSLTSSLRAVIREMDPNLPLYQVSTMEVLLAEATAQDRITALLLGAFALTALLLASVGIYGVISYSVSQRTHEIGIRMALGAQRRDIFKLVVGQGMVLTLAGVGVGLAASFGLTRFLQSLLFGVSATDPVTFAGVALLLVAVALLACYIPARRATRVDPLVALRYE